MASERPTTLLLADDHDLVREAMSVFLAQEPDVDVVGHARNGAEAVKEAKRLKPDVVLMDVQMPGMSGPEATALIKSAGALRRTRVLILTTFDDGDVMQACLKAGADGFLGKGGSPQSLLEGIRAVIRGESPLSPRAARSALGTPATGIPPAKIGHDPRLAALTAREIEIVALAGQGYRNAGIARQLTIAPTTVKTHVRNAMKKLQVHDRAQLVALAHRLGLVRPGGS